MDTKDSMNPVDYWYNTNPRLNSFMYDYWEQNKSIIPEQQLLDDMALLFKDCATYEKLQCLSVLSAIRLIQS